MAIWRTVAGVVSLGIVGVVIGGAVIAPAIGAYTTGVTIGTVGGAFVGGLIGRWRDKVAEAKEARGEPTRTEPAHEERLKKIKELEAKYREETPRLEEIPVGFFRELSHDLKLEIAYKALQDHGLGGAIKKAITRKLGSGEIRTKEHLSAFIGEVVRKISQVDVWHSNGDITPEQAEEAKNGLKNGDDKLYKKYLQLIKSR